MRLLPALLLLTVVGCGQSAGSAEPERGTPERPYADSWIRLDDSPLSPRLGPVAAVLGGKVVFVGGDPGRPCPPNADCTISTYAVDGASYDPATRRWTPVADAPRPVADSAPHAVVGNHLFIRVEGALLDYDAAGDRWQTRDLTGASPDWYSLVADGPRLVLVSGSDEEGPRPDRVLDTRTGAWAALPDDPLGLSFDRTVTATPAGLVLTAKQMDAEGNPADPAILRGALLPPGAEAWTRLPDSEQLGGGRWSWTGKRLVDPTLGGSDGGEVDNYGRTIPYGGALDPRTGRWTQLLRTPKESTGGWPVEALAGPVVASGGWLYDDAAGSWTRLPRPRAPGRRVSRCGWATPCWSSVGPTGAASTNGRR
jgi:hypothetical protein